MANADVNHPPAGGFQNGGWYWDPAINQARQFWNGSFGGGTTINNPNQQGYGQQVSQEVQKQSGYVAPNTGGGGGGAPVDNSGGANGFFGANKAPSLDVNKLYSDSMDTPEIQALNKEITDLNAKVADRQKAQADAEAQINDNPFYAEATRVGKVAKLREAANADLNVLQNQINTKSNTLAGMKGDAQTKINVALKQYDINNQEYQNNLTRFNTLLQAGALTNASGQDLADISAATGISTSMLNSIVKKAKQDEIKPQVITSTDNNGNVHVAVVDLNTGNIISNNSLGAIGASSSASAGGGYGSLANKYLDNAVAILKDEDTSSQKAAAGSNKYALQKVKEDKLLSKDEFQRAYARIQGLVGDPSVASALMDRAWSTGGYQRWQW